MTCGRRVRARILLMQHDQILGFELVLGGMGRRKPYSSADVPVAPGACAAALRRASTRSRRSTPISSADAPHRVVLQLVQLAVGIDDLPHQADERLARIASR